MNRGLVGMACVVAIVGCGAKRSEPLPPFPAKLSVECFTPGPDDYSLTLVVRDTLFTDTAWVRPILDGVAGYWRVEVPLPRRSVDVAVSLFRDERRPVARVAKGSGRREFDVRALTAVENALADANRPLTTRYDRDTLQLLVRFGPSDVEDVLVQTWLSVAQPPRPRRGNPQPDHPAHGQPGQRVVAVFMVDSLGAVDAASIQVVQATDDGYARAVLDVLPHWRFTPSMVRGCKVAREVRWVFGDSSSD
jgi:hypothetical protein